MIPKTIHYCWFGTAEKPKIFHDCLASWKTHCPNFEIKEWNESNTKEFQNKFYKDAYRKKKFAFVADCIRVQVLHEWGGIYLDTDMLLVRPIDPLLSKQFIIGEEVKGRINFAFFAAEKGQRLVSKMKQFYEETPFNEFSLPVITHTFTPMITMEPLQQGEIIFPPEYFYPLTYQDKDKDYKQYLTENSYAVHLWDHSWKGAKKESKTGLFKNLMKVCADYLFYGYPNAYFKRYAKEFSRKLYHRLVGKKVG